MLVISDPLPPMGPLTAFQASMLYRLIEERYSSGGVVVATVNVASDEEADSRMGAQTWDRLCDKSVKCHCNWPSYRKPWKTV
jgi:DNA replication protein DnaC